MSQRALVTVDGYEFPQPSSYDATTSTLVDSARNAQGYVIGSVLREDVAKIELSWRFLSVEDWSRILKCFNTKYGGSFYNTVTFFNQVTGTWESREMYISDRKAGIWLLDDSGNPRGYDGCKLSLVEV